jgi:multicomponent Na+:H+ antiporter subunit D
MIVSAGFEEHKLWVGFLLLLASAGTFLHTGLKVPYFIWFGKNKPKLEVWNRATEPPWNMNVSMAITAFLCIFIGCYPVWLYKMLPYPEEAMKYLPQVYSGYHISETLQILLFTGLGFFLLLKKLVPDPTISLDMDWFYRIGGRAFLQFARKPVQAADTFVGELYRLAGLIPLMLSARVAGMFDNSVIDGLVDGLATSVRGVGRRLRFAQRGQMQQNLTFAFAVTAVLIVAFIIYSNR